MVGLPHEELGQMQLRQAVLLCSLPFQTLLSLALIEMNHDTGNQCFSTDGVKREPIEQRLQVEVLASLGLLFQPLLQLEDLLRGGSVVTMKFSMPGKSEELKYCIRLEVVKSGANSFLSIRQVSPSAVKIPTK